MRESLYIRLRDPVPDAATPFRVDGAAPGGTRVARLADVLAECAGKRVVVFVPGADVRLAMAVIPARQAGKALQAAPYVLEEQFAEEVDSLHFALGARQTDGRWPVAVLSRQRMSEWLTPFRQAGARVDLMLPETLSLPVPAPERYCALAEERLCTVRSGLCGGFVCRPEDLAAYLDLADPDRRLGLTMITPREVPTDFAALGRAVDLLPEFGTALDALIRHHSTAAAINLLQGEFAPASDLRRAWQPWRRAAMLAAASVLASLSLSVAEAVRLERAADAQMKANLARFRQIVPGQTRASPEMLDSLIASELRRVQGGGDVGLLYLTQRFAAGMSTAKGLTLRGLQWREQSLYLNLTGSDLQPLESLRDWFAQQSDVRLEVETANAGSGGVQIRLKLTAA